MIDGRHEPIDSARTLIRCARLVRPITLNALFGARAFLTLDFMACLMI
jgi:hypothetical protein